MPVGVVRCADLPVPHVPSRVVTCANCHRDCWLSIKTGEETFRIALSHGDGRILCVPCLPLVIIAESMRGE